MDYILSYFVVIVSSVVWIIELMTEDFQHSRGNTCLSTKQVISSYGLKSVQMLMAHTKYLND